MRLDLYTTDNFDRGKPKWVELLWLVVHALFVSSWLPGSGFRVGLLRIFGAAVGQDVVLKPGLKVKFPWRLRVGDHTWIGEDVWIDNLAEVAIGANCCISQDAYLCTGSHDWSKPTFGLIVKPIRIKDCAWVAARAVVAPGVTIGEGAVLGLGSVATEDLMPWKIYQGCPAKVVRDRKIPGPSDAH